MHDARHVIIKTIAIYRQVSTASIIHAALGTRFVSRISLANCQKLIKKKQKKKTWLSLVICVLWLWRRSSQELYLFYRSVFVYVRERPWSLMSFRFHGRASARKDLPWVTPCIASEIGTHRWLNIGGHVAYGCVVGHITDLLRWQRQKKEKPDDLRRSRSSGEYFAVAGHFAKKRNVKKHVGRTFTACHPYKCFLSCFDAVPPAANF